MALPGELGLLVGLARCPEERQGLRGWAFPPAQLLMHLRVEGQNLGERNMRVSKRSFYKLSGWSKYNILKIQSLSFINHDDIFNHNISNI